MRIVEQSPRAVRELENVWIPLSDGTQLAARIWLPADAERDPVPAILEYLPYRKRDGTAERDHLTHPYFAGHGYAGVRVDMRGSGESDGLLLDEYLKQEQDDALEVIKWIAAQPWCTGSVGMIGISWGGFNGLQVAARRPLALKAVITICSTDDRYADDIHYMGGCLLNQNLGWASTMLAYMSRPPDPQLVGKRWRELWMHRLEHEPLLIDIWLRHQHRDAYWRHGSVCEDFGAIECPIYAVGGWADGYSNAVPRMLAGLKVPCKGLIGPWAHRYPHFAKPGPQIGFLQECLRWWDHWLKGWDTGIMAEPMLRLWLQEWVSPQPHYEERPGRWIVEPGWPSPNIKTSELHFGDGTLQAQPMADRVATIRSPLDTGLASGCWFSFATGPHMPTDQREDDGKSLVFDTAPLEERLEIVGAPIMELELAVDRPEAFICVRLNDVAPDSSSLRVTYGLLNLTHRNGHERPEPLEPGRHYRVRVQLCHIAHAFSPGHRIRVAISTSYWPIAWPSPEPVLLSLFTGASRIMLPVRAPRPDDGTLPPLLEPESAPPQTRVVLRSASDRRLVERDVGSGVTMLILATDDGAYRIADHGLELDMQRVVRYRTIDHHPNRSEIDIAYSVRIGRGEWRTRTETRTVMRSTVNEFLIEAMLDAYEGETRILSRNWASRIPREGV